MSVHMTLGEQLLLIGRMLVRSLTHAFAEKSGLTYQQLTALHAVENEGVRTQSALAERMLIDAAAASRLVDRLSEDGLLERLAGEDRRCVRLQVTQAGQQRAKLFRVEFDAVESRIEKALTERELKTLEQLLGKIVAEFRSDSTKS